MNNPDCIFCAIAAGRMPATILWQDDDLVAFLDISPIREGHSHIIPRLHYQTFEQMPPDLAGRMMVAGQDLARRMKDVYHVGRVAFLLTGGDVPHVHAHVVPMHEKTDITSARYLVGPVAPQWSSEHLRADPATLREVRARLGFADPAGG